MDRNGNAARLVVKHVNPFPLRVSPLLSKLGEIDSQIFLSQRIFRSNPNLSCYSFPNIPLLFLVRAFARRISDIDTLTLETEILPCCRRVGKLILLIKKSNYILTAGFKQPNFLSPLENWTLLRETYVRHYQEHCKE